MFVAFAAFGMLPIIGFVGSAALYPHLDTARLFAIACVVTGLCLFGLGAFKARFHDKQYLRSGVETLLLGGACAAVAYFVGQAVSSSLGIHSALFALPPPEQLAA